MNVFIFSHFAKNVNISEIFLIFDYLSSYYCEPWLFLLAFTKNTRFLTSHVESLSIQVSIQSISFLNTHFCLYFLIFNKSYRKYMKSALSKQIPVLTSGKLFLYSEKNFILHLLSNSICHRFLCFYMISGQKSLSERHIISSLHKDLSVSYLRYLPPVYLPVSRRNSHLTPRRPQSPSLPTMVRRTPPAHSLPS